MAGYQKPSIEEVEKTSKLLSPQQQKELLKQLDKIHPPDQKELDRRKKIVAENEQRMAQGLPLKPIATVIGGMRIGDVKPGAARVATQQKQGNVLGPIRWNAPGPPPPPPPPPKQEFPPRPPGLSPFHWEEMHRQQRKELEMRKKLWPNDPRLTNKNRLKTLRENMTKGKE